MRNTLKKNVELVINNAGTGGKRFANGWERLGRPVIKQVCKVRSFEQENLSYVPEVYDLRLW